MTAKLLTHPFDARSVMLFASITLGSAFAQAQPISNLQRQSAANTTPRVVQVERQLHTSDPRRHLARQPTKKNL